MNQFKKLNKYIGWLMFFFASFVYLSTIEQTVSFWDCGEYIATAYKLEVGHPPGAPFFQLFGRIFTLFAAQGTSEVAVAINVMSALCSSFSILFLFWTITAFGRKLFFNNEEEIEIGKIIAVLGSGMVGALTYTFSDSFWFSAVEGEVYAMSSLFTAVTFWCIMKWEEESDKLNASRWLVLIGYLIGLSVGVHLLSLLTIPAMGMIYYFKKYPYTKGGAIKAFIVSVVILGLVQAVIIPGAVSLISKFELFFVNTIGLPFNSGTIIYFLTIIGAITLGLSYTKKHKKPIWNTAILGIMMLLIGYSSFAILVVRSNANPPIDENNPEDAVGLLSYLKREQYGSWPIVYGQHFNAKLDSREPYIDGNPIYAKGFEIKVPNKNQKKDFTTEKGAKEYIEKFQIKGNFTDIAKDKYVVIDQRKNRVPNYSSKDKMLFPRIWSATQASHAGGYANWSGSNWKKTDKGWVDENGRSVKPNLNENLTYFLKYQIGWSYLRYFMWNFAGRQNDYMNMDGNSLHGNWESGISGIDKAILGTPSSDILIPNHLADNKGKNHYYFLPLILGLIGMFFHFNKSSKDAISVLLFFLFTGVLIIIYLNVVPFQPRERDYAYVGSFYAFSIWVGLGVLGIYKFLNSRKKIIFKNKSTSWGLAIFCSLIYLGILKDALGPNYTTLIILIPIAFIFNIIRTEYIGIGKIKSKKKAAVLATIISLISVPLLMAAENWDDHDRSGRFTALEVAKNYLNSCDKNAILFTNGDNDTFPLWYAQEVEGIRTDIKVVNLSLFNTDWYIDQMKRASYDAPPIPSSLEHDDYRTGTRDYTPIQERVKGYVEVKDVVGFINSKSPKAKINTSAGLRNYCPTKKLKLTVNKDLAKTFVPNEYHDKIVDEIRFNLKGSGIFKNKLLVLDILANFNWERPIYFAITVGRDNYMGLEKYFQLEGLAYRLVPYSITSSDGQTGVVHTKKMYEKLMTKFKWGGLNNPNIYFDETNTRMVMNFRNNYSRLAESLYQKGAENVIKTLNNNIKARDKLLLIKQGFLDAKTGNIKKDAFLSQPQQFIRAIDPIKESIDSSYIDSINLMAIAVLDKCMYEFPNEVVSFNYFTIPMIDLYYKMGEDKKGGEILAKMIENHLAKLKYLKGFDNSRGIKQNISITSQVLNSLTRILQIHNLQDVSYNYINEDGIYYKEKEGNKEEVSFSTYRINTFMEDYLSIQ